MKESIQTRALKTLLESLLEEICSTLLCNQALLGNPVMQAKRVRDKLSDLLADYEEVQRQLSAPSYDDRVGG